MKKELIQFLLQFPELTKRQVEELAEELILEEIKKNTVIVNQGQHCGLCYFVLKGCLRQFVIINGVEKTIAIYTEGQAVNYYTNQITPKPSENYLSSIEDTIALVGNPSKDHELYAKYPILVDITRKMIEVDLGKTQDSLAKLITSSPEERYLNLLKERPELLQRIPQHIIASFLGITPESLSRIRKRVHKK
mgnify:CR=1 FL=1